MRLVWVTILGAGTQNKVVGGGRHGTEEVISLLSITRHLDVVRVEYCTLDCLDVLLLVKSVKRLVEDALFLSLRCWILGDATILGNHVRYTGANLV